MLISRAPKTKDSALDVWNYDLQTALNNELKSLFVPAIYTGTHGYHPARQMTALASTNFGFSIPLNTREVKEVVIRFIPTTTGTISYTATMAYAGEGEDEALATSTKTETLIAIIDDRIEEVDITSMFSAVEKVDQIGIQFVVDALVTTTNIQLLGLVLKYI